MAFGVAGQTKLLLIKSMMDMDRGSCVLGTVLSLVDERPGAPCSAGGAGVGTRGSLPLNIL